MFNSTMDGQMFEMEERTARPKNAAVGREKSEGQLYNSGTILLIDTVL